MTLTKNLLLYFSAFCFTLISCTPKAEEQCECCEVKVATVSLSPAHTKLFSKFKESDSYDVNPKVTIIKSHFPLPTGMDIWANGYAHEAAFADKPECKAVTFSLKEINYFHYATLWVGFKESKKAYETNTLYAKNNIVNRNYDTSTLFVKLYNELSPGSADIPFELVYNEKDSLIKHQYYGDFLYLGSLTWEVPLHNGSLQAKYDHVFEVRTREGEPEWPRFIYIDRDYGLVKYVLNNGDVWSIIH